MILAEVGLVAVIVIGLILSAVTVALSELLRPKPKFENARPAGIGEFKFPTAIEGRPVPIVFGTVKYKGPNVVWYGDLRQTAIRTKIKTGLWSSRKITTGFQYRVGFQLGLCRGPIAALTKVWVGDVEVFSGSVTVEAAGIVINNSLLFGGDDLGTGGVDGTLRLHLGSETQAADVYLGTVQSPIPSYRGTCYVVWEGGYIGNSTQIKPWAFEIQRFPNSLGLPSGQHIVAIFEANPAAVIYEFLTDGDWGLGLPTSDVDSTSFLAAGATLFTEGNGFSFVLDQVRDASEFLREVERQIDGIVFLDPGTGKLKLKLTRADYDINTVPQIDATNVKEVKDFMRGTWDETTNQIRIQFTDRDKKYSESFAQAHDLANQRVQGGEIVAVTENFPGVKSRALANNIASRSLRQLSAPLAKANIVIDRTGWNLNLGDAVAWTDATLGFTKLAMRIIRVDIGSEIEGSIELGMIQDVFSFASPFFGQPDNTLWTLPSQNVDPFPTANQRAIEAPKALTDRDEALPGVADRIFATGRLVTGNEITHRIWQRNAVGAPSGSFILSGEVYGFCLMGELRTALTAGTGNPMTVQMNGTPDTLAALQAAFTVSPSAGDIGQNLVNLILVDDEFMAITTVVNQTTHLDLQNTYRGMLDTAPAAHAVNAKIFLVFVGSGLSDVTIPPTNNVDVKLRPRSRTDEVTEAEAVTISFTMANRARRPYPPTQLKLNTVLYPTSVDFDTLKSGGTTLDDRGIDSAYTRRDFRRLDEVQQILTDAGTLDPTFPAANNTKYKAKLIKDPAGTPVTLFETVFNTGQATIFLSRTRILRNNAGVKPTSLRVEITARHDLEGVTSDAIQLLRFDFSVGASTLDNDTNMGVIAQNVTSSPFTAPTAGTYTFTIGTVLPVSGTVEANINGGVFTTVIAAGLTTGTLAGVAVSDLIRTRHTSSGSGIETFLEVDSPGGSTVDGYAILV